MLAASEDYIIEGALITALVISIFMAASGFNANAGVMQITGAALFGPDADAGCDDVCLTAPEACAEQQKNEILPEQMFPTPQKSCAEQQNI